MQINSTLFYHKPGACWRTRVTIKERYDSEAWTLPAEPAGLSEEAGRAVLADELRRLADAVEQTDSFEGLVAALSLKPKPRRPDYDPHAKRRTQRR